MHFLNHTYPENEANLALDEALLQDAEEGRRRVEILRLWRAESPLIVVGRSTKVQEEVQVERAVAANIPILRRISGGATILAAPGCLFYAVLLSLAKRPHLRMLDQAHEFVMSRIVESIQPLSAEVRLDGTCDVTVAGRKVSGNSMRLQRDWLLYHGTLLLHMDLGLLNEYLRHPPREPDYRSGRPHDQFVANLNVDAQALMDSLRRTWQAERLIDDIDDDRVQELARERYGQRSWNYQR